MWTIIKKIPWWGWVGIAVAIFIVWQGATGAAFSNKMWKMVKNQITTDQSRIIEIKNEQEKWYESEIAKRDTIIAQNQKKIDVLTAGKALSDAKVRDLEGRNKELEDALSKIIVSRDPDSVIKSLQQRFPTIKRIK